MKEKLPCIFIKEIPLKKSILIYKEYKGNFIYIINKELNIRKI